MWGLLIKSYTFMPIAFLFQANTRPVKFTNYEGLAYLGEYHLAWAACLGNEGIYNLLLEHGANPDAQDSFGNSVLHMVVVSNNMVWVSTTTATI